MPDLDYPYDEGNSPDAIVSIPMDTIVRWKPYVLVKGMATKKDRERLLGMTNRSPEFYVSSEDNKDLMYDLADVFAQVNDEYYHFSLTGMYQAPQILTYTPSKQPDGPNSWHMDYSPTDRSKLSMSMCLESAGKGGTLEIGQEGPVILKPGDAVFFPSYINHRVTKVVKGMRVSLVAWAAGPAFV